MINALVQYHPLVIEGMGGYDPRDPNDVASRVIDNLRRHWLKRPPSKPTLLITQGDPLEKKGIAAVTRRVSDELNISRGLIYLDPEIADYHFPNADRYKVIFEIPYSQMRHALEMTKRDRAQEITEHVMSALQIKNDLRQNQGKSLLPSYYRDFALLQEVTKAACKQISGSITLTHTSSDISQFSVSSFYHVGLDLGLINEADIAKFPD